MGIGHRLESLIMMVIGIAITYGCASVFYEENYYAPRKFLWIGPAFIVVGLSGLVLPAHYFYRINPKYSDLPIDVLFKAEKTTLFWVMIGIGCLAGFVTWQVFEHYDKVW